MEEKYQPAHQGRTPEGVVQNFFIMVSNPGSGTEVVGNTQVDNIMHAVRAALGGSAAQAEVSVKRATFEEVGQEWFQHNAATWAASYKGRLKTRLETYLLEAIGGRPIASVTPPELLEVIRKIEIRDARETARRILRIASAVFRYGIATGQCTQDPTLPLKGALRPPKAVKHRAALTARDLPKFLKALAQYHGDLTKHALELVLLTFVRTSELRFAKWSEFEGLGSPEPIWRIPAERMKTRRAHLVPLSKQAVSVLQRLRELGHASAYVLPANTTSGVISENTLLFALYRMGYRRRATVHGFRSLASTVLNEAQFNRDWVEMQLAHADNTVRGVYNAAEWLSGRRDMLQWWADYLDDKRR